MDSVCSTCTFYKAVFQNVKKKYDGTSFSKDSTTLRRLSRRADFAAS
jgi:hypothetical protein